MSGAPPGEPPRRGRLGALQAALPLLVPVFGGLILAFILFDELNRDDIEVRPIAVPARLAEAGFTPEVAALRLMDALLELQASVGAEPRRRTGDATGPHPDFTVPLTGLSLRSLASALRDSFGLPERRVTGEVTQEGETLRLRLRLSGQGVIADVAAATPDALLRAGAPQVWRAVQPVLYAWWLAGEAPTEASMREALSEMMARPSADARLMLTTRLLYARSLLRSGEAEAALVAHDALLQDSPGYAPALYGRGRALRELGRLDEAMDALQAAQRALPSASFPRIGIAQILRDRGEAEAALALLSPLLRDPGVDQEVRTEAAMALLALGRSREALPLARRAVAEDPRSPAAHTALGLALLRERQAEAALRAFDVALQLAPLWAEAQLFRAEALRALGREAEALAVLEQVRPLLQALPRLRAALP